MHPKVGMRGISIAIVFGLIATALPLAVTADSSNNVGAHAYKFNIIGRPNDWNGDDSNANTKTLFISLDSYDGEGSICEEESGVVDDQPGGSNIVTTEPSGGQRLYFTGTEDGSFYVIDRDATDGSARIAIPESSGTGGFDVYIRVLGKPGGCLDADGYAVDVDGATGTTWYFSGHLDANRKSGVPGKVNINDMFDVWVCTEVDLEGNCITWSEISVFDEMFEDYFWQIQNNKLRNMQLIFYEVA